MKIHKRHSEGKMGFEHLFLTQKAYKYINMIGKGGFGKVWKVEHTATGRIYAMKEMSKAMYNIV
jgi:serine/threonine protein kinase